MRIILLWVLLGSFCSFSYVEKTDKLRGADARLQKNVEIEEPYVFNFRGREFIGLPNVYSPVIFPGAQKQKDLDIKSHESFLEIGPGTGIFSIIAALNGAQRVVAVDINPDAVENTQQNIQLHAVDDKVMVLQGDMFAPLSIEERFDVIFFNIPFCHRSNADGKMTMLAKSIFDPEHDLLHRFLKEGKNYLTSTGRMLLGYSTTHGDIDLMYQWANENNWEVLQLSKEGDDFITVELYEFKQKAVGDL